MEPLVQRLELRREQHGARHAAHGTQRLVARTPGPACTPGPARTPGAGCTLRVERAAETGREGLYCVDLR